MVGVAQLVRAPDCGSGGRGFKSHHSPQKASIWGFFLCQKFDNSCKFFYSFYYIINFMPSWLNWIEHWVSAPAVTGSNPVEGTLSIKGEFDERFNIKNKYK